MPVPLSALETVPPPEADDRTSTDAGPDRSNIPETSEERRAEDIPTFDWLVEDFAQEYGLTVESLAEKIGRLELVEQAYKTYVDGYVKGFHSADDVREKVFKQLRRRYLPENEQKADTIRPKKEVPPDSLDAALTKVKDLNTLNNKLQADIRQARSITRLSVLNAMIGNAISFSDDMLKDLRPNVQEAARRVRATTNDLFNEWMKVHIIDSLQDRVDALPDLDREKAAATLSFIDKASDQIKTNFKFEPAVAVCNKLDAFRHQITRHFPDLG